MAMAALDIFLKEKKHLHFVTEIQKNTDVSGKKLKERKEIVGIILPWRILLKPPRFAALQTEAHRRLVVTTQSKL